MSGVDVLAELDDAIELRSEDGYSRIGTLRQARAAVAELIEAAQYRVEWVNGSWYAVTSDGSALSNVPRDEAGARAEIAEALAAALAACRGQA